MTLGPSPTTIVRRADLVSYDDRDRAVLLVEVEQMPWDEDHFFQLLDDLKGTTPIIPFGMLVDPEKVIIVTPEAEGPRSPLCRLKTADILRAYDADVGKKRIFYPYLRTLVESWLLDLADHWKSREPPGSRELAEIGLLSRLEGGTTRNEVPLYGDPLH